MFHSEEIINQWKYTYILYNGLVKLKLIHKKTHLIDTYNSREIFVEKKN